MPRQPKIGLLPFYLKLYDDLMPERRAAFESFITHIAEGFQSRGVEVSIAPVCRIREEFEQAVKTLENENVDTLVSLHLAYSPSLESVDVMCQTSLPLIMLDTTMDSDFGRNVAAERIMFNHGVHGVMDFACMLRRRKRHFEIVAGHVSDPKTLDRAVDHVRAVIAAREWSGTRALRVGPAFKGMGDFTVEESILKEKFGIDITEIGIAELDKAVEAVNEADVERELEKDRSLYTCDLEETCHRRSVRIGLGLRSLIEAGHYGAMSVNFQEFDGSERPADTMPFLEISKAMGRGIGYGGEGDVLTAALVGALGRTFEAVTFTEIFCADWTGNALFLSHMGEISPGVAGEQPRVFEKPFFIKNAPAPAVLTCPLKPGPAVYVNLAPGPDDTFTLIVVPVEVLPEDDTLDPAMHNTVRGWIQPQMPVVDFLESYARAGGTHHSALVLGPHVEAICAFGRHVKGIDVLCLDQSVSFL